MLILLLGFICWFFFLSLQFVLDSVENSLFLSELPWELFQGQC